MAETLVSKIVANAGKNWSRNTVADGNWLNANTIVKLNQNDITLAEAIDDLSASMPHILPEYPGFKLNFESNETIKSIEQKTTGELVVEKQGIDIESTTLNDKLWAHLNTNDFKALTSEYSQLYYDGGDFSPQLAYVEPGSQGDGCTTTALGLSAGIYSIYLELSYKLAEQDSIEAIEKEVFVGLYNGDTLLDEISFHVNDTYKEIEQHRLVNAVVKFASDGTLVIKGKTETGHVNGGLKINNLYIVSVGGATGPKGDPGTPGADGYSPTVEISEGEHQHRITITDKDHPTGQTTLINDGANGADGKSVELSANPLNAHLNWRQEGDTNWTDTGFAVSGEVGPRGTAPTVTSTPNPSVGGYDVTFHYGDTLEDVETITVPSGVSGNPGISPSISTSAIPGTPGGTTVIITDATHDAEHPLTFDIRNGNDGQGFQEEHYYNKLSAHSADNAQNAVNADYATYAYIDSNTSSAMSDIVDELHDKLEAPNDAGPYQKDWLVHTDGQGHTSWTEAQTWLANRIVPENGLSGWGDATNGQYHFGISADYVATSGDTMTGALTVSAATGQNMLAVASAASLVGASRQTEANFGQNNTAIGTTWMGVGAVGTHNGFFKFTRGGAVGALDSNETMQINFTPDNKGQIFAQAYNSGNQCPETQVLNPTKASCDSMVQSANANLVSGPNYMLAKNSDGQFVIGAACVNCTDINNVTLAPNTYYFVYEV